MEGEAAALGGGSHRRPHVLLFPFPSQGHINPILDLGRRLAASGLLSTLVLTPGLLRKQQQQQQQQQQGPFDLLLRFEALDLTPELDAAISSPKVFEIVNTELLAPLRSLILASHARSSYGDHADGAAAELPPVSCLVSDSFMPWTVGLTAELGIPRAEMWTSSTSAYIMGSYIPELFARGLLPFKQGTNSSPTSPI
jgi:hypothetical protein